LPEQGYRGREKKGIKDAGGGGGGGGLAAKGYVDEYREGQGEDGRPTIWLTKRELVITKSGAARPAKCWEEKENGKKKTCQFVKKGRGLPREWIFL